MIALSHLEAFPMVAALVADQKKRYGSLDISLTTEEAIRGIKDDFDRQGPYQFAKQSGLLVNGSGEEFAIQFMSYVNTQRPGTY